MDRSSLAAMCNRSSAMRSGNFVLITSVRLSSLTSHTQEKAAAGVTTAAANRATITTRGGRIVMRRTQFPQAGSLLPTVVTYPLCQSADSACCPEQSAQW